jgi:hypothetical protein
MTKYEFHRPPSGTQHTSIPSVSLTAESHLHGAALALRYFKQAGCDITAPLAHLDLTEPDGAKQMVLVEEVLDWLHEPTQTAFVDREALGVLLG